VRTFCRQEVSSKADVRIGAGSGGAVHTFILGYCFQGTLVSGSKRRPKSGEDHLISWRKLDFRAIRLSNSGEDLFFLENAGFRAIRLSNSGEDLFFSKRTLIFGTESNPCTAKIRISQCRLWRLWSGSPCPKIVPAPLDVRTFWCKKTSDFSKFMM